MVYLMGGRKIEKRKNEGNERVAYILNKSTYVIKEEFGEKVITINTKNYLLERGIKTHYFFFLCVS